MGHEDEASPRGTSRRDMRRNVETERRIDAAFRKQFPRQKFIIEFWWGAWWVRAYKGHTPGKFFSVEVVKNSVSFKEVEVKQ